MPARKRHTGRKIVWAVLLLAIAGGGYYWYQHKSGAEAEQAETQSYIEVTQGSLEAVVTAQGKLEPKEYVDVGAQVSGQIEKMHAEIGDEVKIGELIAEIDPDVYEARVEGDQARLKTLQAQKAEQEALVRQATQRHGRNKILIKVKAISEEAFDDTKIALDVAQAQLSSINAQIEEAQSTLEGDQTNLSYTKIYAPMSGTVVLQPIKEGQTINATQTAPVIVQVANLDVMTVRAQVAEADVGRLQSGMPVYFTTMGSQDRRWEGNIRQILPSPETVNDVVLYNVLIDVENKDHELMTGMTTQLFFVLGKAENVAIVPMSVLVTRVPEQDTDKGQAYKVRILEGEMPVERIVVIGLSDRTQAEVISGLKAGDRILMNLAPSQNSSAPRGGMRGMARL